MYCVGYVVFNFGEVLLYVSSGGYVMDLWSGFYDLVLVLDYKSLYLLIICIFLIDFVGLVEGMVQFDLEYSIEGFFDVWFLWEKYCLLEIVINIWYGCDEVKCQGNKLFLQVLKIIMNVFYGVFGIIVCCFFDLCLVLLIIMCGYQIMW